MGSSIFEFSRKPPLEPTKNYLKKNIMNALAIIVLSLAAIATAAPGGWRCGRSPGWCKHAMMAMAKAKAQADNRQAPALKTIAGTAAATPALSTLLAAAK